VKIESDLHSDVERLAEMTSPPPEGGVTKVTDVSEMPCRLIGGLHEWTNEPPAVPVWVPVNLLAGAHARVPRREAKTPWSFTAVCRWGVVVGVERRREP